VVPSIELIFFLQVTLLELTCTHSKSESGSSQRVVVIYGVRTRETLERPVQLAARIDSVGLAGLCRIPRYAESNGKFTPEA
jgi:hypothetical protein